VSVIISICPSALCDSDQHSPTHRRFAEKVAITPGAKQLAVIPKGLIR